MQGRVLESFRTRTKQFASDVIIFYVGLPKEREEVKVCGKQLLRAGTSVAAHVREASRARSKEEFIAKLGVALQETDEAQLWLELLRESCGITSAKTLPLENEANELMAIFTTIIKKTKETL